MRIRLSSLEELQWFVLAFVIVTVLYVPALLGLGKVRQAQVEEVRKALDSKFLAVADERAESYVGEVDELIVGAMSMPTPAVAEAKARALTKALNDRNQFWVESDRLVKTDGASVRDLQHALRPAIASRFFGWEQWISYCLTVWALTLLWKTRKLLLMTSQPGKSRHAMHSSDVESNLAMVRFTLWAIPTIGFIGTVRGMGSALSVADSPDKIPQIVGYLGVAFDTTLVGLLLSILLMFAKHRFEKIQDQLAATAAGSTV